jgi:hypothetical protein
MPDETVLRARAREVIRTGKLPSRRPDRTWAWRKAWAICCSVNRGFFAAILPSAQEGRRRVKSSSPNWSSFLGAGPWEFERDRNGRPHS